MRRVRLTALGFDLPLVLDNNGAPPPAPQGHELLVRVEACGVCHRDLIDRGGGVPFMRVPITLGHEVAGRVVAAGAAVTLWKVGDRVATMQRDSCGECAACAAGDTTLCERAAFVLGILSDGGYASHLLVPERGVYRVPEDLAAGEAAALQCTFGTAYRGLRSAGCAPGRTALIVGAAGGVGSAAIQVARRLGARVVAVVRHERHVAYVTGLGADVAVVDRGDAFHKHPACAGVDLALDCVGSATLNATLRSLRLGGTVVAVGNLAPAERLSLNVGLVIVKALRVIGSSGANARDMAELLALRGDRPFQLTVSERPLAQAEAAHQALRAGGVEGRIALVP
jgi:acryloyl-coenzyme A reductase